MTEEEYEAMRQRALQPFKPSITDEDIIKFEEEIRERSLKNMKKIKDEINDYDKEKIRERNGFIYHL